ncbi:MAG: tRNA 2-thiouridine(34) synthase MnmA [Spirochaetota bacterium]
MASKTIAVAMSGGVDSSVAAYLLSTSGKLIGASHFIWPESTCCRADVLARARAVCKSLGIGHYVIDLVEIFSRDVVGDFVNTYIAGKTPNPCIRCNQRVRFFRFYHQLKEQLILDGTLEKGEVLYFSTGHYVKIEKNQDGIFLAKARDLKKDQSYMLYKIPKEILEVSIFPLGDYLKSEVIRIAAERRIPALPLKESQDACFVGESYPDFIVSFSGRRDLDKPGEIVDTKGNSVGSHSGFIRYTIGQRKGLNLSNGPWYVTGIEPGKNRIIVGRQPEVPRNRFFVEELTWNMEEPAPLSAYTVKVRYNSPDIGCRIAARDACTAEVLLDTPAIISPGQSAVFYKGDMVAGGGIIR